jgi:adiponectin receptor
MASPGSDILKQTSAIQVNAGPESYYRYHLQEWKDLAGWRQDNEYITSGYRTPSGSFQKCLGSLKHIHNETVNVYSHLLGGFLFLGLFFYVLWKISRQYTTIRRVDYIVFMAFFVGIITCFFLSALFHTIANHSEIVAARGVQLDYVGIVLLIWGAAMPSVYYGFYCNPNLQKVYWIVLSSVAFSCILITFNPRFQSSQLRPYRAVMYTALGVSTTIPIVHGILIHGWEIQNQRISFTYVFLTAGLDLVAAVIYSIRFPERWHPIRFDIYGQSHQLLHVIVVLAGLIYLVGLLRAVSFAHSQRGQCA